ncbi:MAG: protein kinase [Agarilytica sp.]
MEIEGYRNLKLVGEGGMAYIYKAVQCSLERDVAIKVLKQKLADENEIRERFFQESQIIAQLNHPNIIQVFDRGVTTDGSPYFVMPFIKGASLETAYKKQALQQHQVLNIFTQICKGLAYAHKNKVVHCDIKPENILVDFEGNAIILDFGISQLFSEGNTVEENYIYGTENYMAPEQQLGLSHTTALSDLYSLGVMMYRFLSRQHPEKPPLSLSNFDSKIPKLLDDVVLACLEQEAEARPESAEYIKNTLLKVLQGDHLNTKQKQRAQADVKKSFQLLDVIKETRFGAIYLFEETTSQNLFVIKKKPSKSGGYEQAKRLVGFEHPNINPVYGASKNARVFILVTQYCTGGSLADQLIQRFDLNTFYPIAIGIAEAMQAAHKANIVHGNVRPSNVLFNEQGQVKLVDFGLQEHYQMSDENWYTNLNEESGTKADIFAAGMVYYQMLLGEAPETNTSSLVKKYRFSKLPQELQHLVRQMIHKDKDKRIESFSEVAASLHALFDEKATTVRATNTHASISPGAGPKHHHGRKNTKRWLILAGIFAATVLAAQFYLLLNAR